MTKKNSTKFMIINRSFWPNYPIIGEALLMLSEKAANKGYSVSVAMQEKKNIRKSLKKFNRGTKTSFFPIKSLANPDSGIFIKLLNSLFFTLAVIRVLFKVQPNKIYISTDPPIIVPFVVMIYCYLFNAYYVYHVQDIHPEATNAIIPLNKWLFYILIKIDSITMRNAEKLITITKEMAHEISKRSSTNIPIYILNNPAISFKEVELIKKKQAGFSFCGNVGRMQRIPILLNAIETYFKKGGNLKFTFAGSGIYAKTLQHFSEKYELFEFLGWVSPIRAAKITSTYSWALLPIEDNVTKYAFPSKTSSYVFANAKILGICGPQTSVAKWINEHELGLSVEPEIEKLVEFFFKIEKGRFETKKHPDKFRKLKSKLQIESFVEKINKIIFDI